MSPCSALSLSQLRESSTSSTFVHAIMSHPILPRAAGLSCSAASILLPFPTTQVGPENQEREKMTPDLRADTLLLLQQAQKDPTTANQEAALAAVQNALQAAAERLLRGQRPEHSITSD